MPRFEAYRYVGIRDTMLFYDCDDEAQFEELEKRVEGERLVGRNLLQTFAPDSPMEAMNRSFRPH